MTLNKKEEARRLIVSKYRRLEEQLVRKYRGCVGDSVGSTRGLKLGFVADHLVVTQKTSDDQEGATSDFVEDVDTRCLVTAAAHIADLVQVLEQEVNSLPLGYQEAVSEVSRQVDLLRGLDTDEVSL